MNLNPEEGACRSRVIALGALYVVCFLCLFSSIGAWRVRLGAVSMAAFIGCIASAAGLIAAPSMIVRLPFAIWLVVFIFCLFLVSLPVSH